MQTVSVAMCTYNGERYLREQLSSIAAQTVRPAEVVICDDASTDDTMAILEEFARTAGLDVKIFRNATNLGSTRNFEQAIERCSGELIALADQDDVWHAGKLERMMERLAEDPSLGAVFCDAELIDEHSRPTGGSLWQSIYFGRDEQALVERGQAHKLLCHRNVVTGAAMMFRAALRPQLLPIDATWIHDGWMAWMVVLHSRLGFVPERLMGYRVHPAQHVGVPLRDWRLRLRLSRLRKSDAKVCAEKARRFEALAAYCGECRDCSLEILGDIRNVIELCRMRERLPSGVLSRANLVFSHVGLYTAYANGLRTILRDLLRKEQPEEPPGASTQI